MKLANIIAKEQCEVLACAEAFTKYRETFEQIIAAHLEPVREALKKIVHEDDAQCKCPACRFGKPILALLDTSVPVTADEGDKRQDVAQECKK